MATTITLGSALAAGNPPRGRARGAPWKSSPNAPEPQSPGHVLKGKG
jgi:hypothetical protein